MWNQLRSFYLERGYGTLLEGHQVEISNDSKMDYKYRDVGKLLWLQVDRVLQILSSLEKCRSGLIRIFENVKELYKTKEYPVGVSFADDSRLSPISSRTVLSPVSTSISSRIFSSFPSVFSSLRVFLSLSPSLQSSLAGENVARVSASVAYFESHQSLTDAIACIESVRLLPVLESSCNRAINRVLSKTHSTPNSHFQALRSISELFFVIGNSFSSFSV